MAEERNYTFTFWRHSHQKSYNYRGNSITWLRSLRSNQKTLNLQFIYQDTEDNDFLP